MVNSYVSPQNQMKYDIESSQLTIREGRFGKTKMFTPNEMKNTLFEGDCLQIMKHFPDNSIDMVLCDLPYGTTQNKWDSVIDLNELWKEYKRVVKPNGAIVLTSQGIFTCKLILSNEKMFKYKWVWVKSKPTNFLNSKKQPLRKHEDVCVFYKKQPCYNPQMTEGAPYDKGYRKDQFSGSYGDFTSVHVKSDGERYPVDVVYFKTAESEGTVYHSTQKPISLGEYMILTYSKPGDLILDNTCGSGSFLISAAKQDRFFCGIELNEDMRLFKKDAIDFIDVCISRLSKVESLKEMTIYRRRNRCRI